MPKRASCHHLIRRMRSASSVSAAACGCDAGVPGCPSADPAPAEAASVTSYALVPNSQLRRGIRFGLMESSSLTKTVDPGQSPQVSRGMIGPWRLLFKFENSFHSQPLFAGPGFRKRLLKFPHQFFPLPHLRILEVSFRFSPKRELLVDFHHHEHARA